MFGIGMMEISLILVVALLVIGPEKMPDLVRSLGKGYAEFKRTGNDLKRAIDIDYHADSKPTSQKKSPSAVVSSDIESEDNV